MLSSSPQNNCWILFQSIIHTVGGVLSCVGCPVGAFATVGTAGAAAGAAAAACASCKLIEGRRRRDAVDEHPRTGRSIIQDADLNGDGVMDVLEATEFLVGDGKLHIEVMTKVLLHYT